MGARRGGGKNSRSPPPLENPIFYCYLGAFFPIWGPFCYVFILYVGSLLPCSLWRPFSYFISMHMGSFSDLFSMLGPFLLLFFYCGGAFLCSCGGFFWACPPPYQHLYGRQCPGCPNKEKNVAKRPPNREK